MHFFKHFSQKALIQALILLISWGAYGQERSLWVTAWDMNTPEKIDALIKDAQKHQFTKIFLQTRYRGDALYFPNRTDSSYSNPEPRSYLLQGSSFDPLAYALEQVPDSSIKIYAWVTTFVVTPFDLRKIDSNHVFYTHPEWLVKDRYGRAIAYNSYEGAFLDPALPQVRQYTLNILADIATNYKVAGIQLDYIRYPDTLYGWNAMSKQMAQWDSTFDFNAWRQQKIASFFNMTYITLKSINPQLEVSASVISDRQKASKKYAQEWWKWMENRYIDQVYIMAYNTSNKSFTNLINGLKHSPYKNKMTVILRSWKESRPYHVSQINNKISICKRAGFYDLGYYNYHGLVSEKYLGQIRF
jgi:uncharacterized lipoprotein YddW (UPF0748 family)